MSTQTQCLYSMPQNQNKDGSSTFSLPKKRVDMDYWFPYGWSDWNFSNCVNEKTSSCTFIPDPSPLNEKKVTPLTNYRRSSSPQRADCGPRQVPYDGPPPLPPSPPPSRPSARDLSPYGEKQFSCRRDCNTSARPIIKEGFVEIEEYRDYVSYDVLERRAKGRTSSSRSPSPSRFDAPAAAKVEEYDARTRTFSSHIPPPSPSCAPHRRSPSRRSRSVSPSRPSSPTSFSPQSSLRRRTSRSPPVYPCPPSAPCPPCPPSPPRPTSSPCPLISPVPTSPRPSSSQWPYGSARPLDSLCSLSSDRYAFSTYVNTSDSCISASDTHIPFEEEVNSRRFCRPVAVKVSFANFKVKSNQNCSEVPENGSSCPEYNFKPNTVSPFLSDFVCKASKNCACQLRPPSEPESTCPFVYSQRSALENCLPCEEQNIIEEKLCKEICSYKDPSSDSSATDMKVFYVNNLQIDPFTFQGPGFSYSDVGQSDCNSTNATLPSVHSVITSPNEDDCFLPIFNRKTSEYRSPYRCDGSHSLGPCSSSELPRFRRYKCSPSPACTKKSLTDLNRDSFWYKTVNDDGYWSYEEDSKSDWKEYQKQKTNPWASFPFLGLHSKPISSNRRSDESCYEINQLQPDYMTSLSKSVTRVAPKRARSLNAVAGHSEPELPSKPLASSDPTVLIGAAAAHEELLRDVDNCECDRSRSTNSTKQHGDEKRRAGVQEEARVRDAVQARESHCGRVGPAKFPHIDATLPYIASLRQRAGEGSWHATVVAQGVEFTVSATVINT